MGILKVQIYYSKSKQAFFVTGIHENIPEDKIEVSEEQHIKLIDEINNNQKTIDVDDSGKIILVDKVKDLSLQKQTIIQTRNAMLSESDWTMMPDAPFTKEQQKKWKEYRQALRDISEQEGFPETVIWPEAPNRKE